MGADLGVVEADDRQVVRDVDAAAAGHCGTRDGHQVVGVDHGGRRIGEVE
jgi:hypothetical protein